MVTAAQDKAPAPAPKHPIPAQPDSGPLVLSEVQRLRLESAQKDVIIAQQQSIALHQQASQADQNAQKALNDYHAVAERVRKENSWADDYTFDDAKMQFSRPAPKPAEPPKPDAAKDDKKP